MHAFEVLADPVRRRLLEVLAHGEQPAGALVDIARADFGITQPAVSRQLGILRDEGYVTVRAEGARRIYAIAADATADAERALAQLRAPLQQRLDALHTEIARGRRATTAARSAARRKDAS